MLPQSTYIQIDLVPGEAVSLRGADGCLLRCMRGKVWLTEENGGLDVVLAVGDSFLLTRKGRAVIESIDKRQSACCRLVPARSSPLSAALQRWIQSFRAMAAANAGRPEQLG